MKLFTKSMEPNTTLGVAERMAYMSGNIGIALINTIVATFLMSFYDLDKIFPQIQAELQKRNREKQS